MTTLWLERGADWRWRLRAHGFSLAAHTMRAFSDRDALVAMSAIIQSAV
jgi:hypothetical protein